MIYNSTLSPPSHYLPPIPPVLQPNLRAKRKPDPNPHKSTPPCTECGKRFSSLKALFGHMRCHPERQWRGIKPPPHSLRAHFTDEEFQVAAILLLLANGPPPSPICSPPASVSIVRCGGRAGLTGGDGRGMKKKAREIVKERFGFRLFDLNLPPPVENDEEDCGLVLDLKLGAGS